MGRNILLTLEYDGTDFRGWQVQPQQRTVQGELESVLRPMLKQPELRTTGSGRTDSGVHALGMGASFLCESSIPLEGLVRGLNAQLPDDLCVLEAREVPMQFCARRWAQGKRYRYCIWNAKRPSALLRNRTWFQYEPLHVEAMREAAQHLLGRHNFACFRASGCASKHPVRDIYSIDIYRNGEQICIEVSGSAFLRHMVRNIAGSLVEVGRGQQPPSWMKEVLDSQDRRNAAGTAPAQGLSLVEVRYKLSPAFP